MKDKLARAINKILHIINGMHLYSNKPEGLVKAIIITISWIGGVHLTDKPDEISRTIAVTFYLFAISMIMEYVFRIFFEKKTLEKLLPLIISFLNFIVFFGATAILLDKRIDAFTYQRMYLCSLVPIFLIWVDVFLMLIFSPPKDQLIENKITQLPVTCITVNNGGSNG